MRTRRPTRTAITLLALAIPVALAGCGGSSGSSATTSAVPRPTGASGITGSTQPPPQLPYALGTRAALGDWELSVDAAIVGATTTVQARLVNVTSQAVPAPAASAFTLRDGVMKLPTTATVDGLPTRMQPNVDTRITITFASATAPVDPYLRWNGTTRDAVTADFKLTAGEPTVPLD